MILNGKLYATVINKQFTACKFCDLNKAGSACTSDYLIPCGIVAKQRGALTAQVTFIRMEKRRARDE